MTTIASYGAQKLEIWQNGVQAEETTSATVRAAIDRLLETAESFDAKSVAATVAMVELLQLCRNKNVHHISDESETILKAQALLPMDVPMCTTICGVVNAYVVYDHDIAVFSTNPYYVE